MDTRPCPHCAVRILPTSFGICPSCLKSTFEPPAAPTRKTTLRYSLCALLIVLTIGPPILAAAYWSVIGFDRKLAVEIAILGDALVCPAMMLAPLFILMRILFGPRRTRHVPRIPENK